MFTKEDVPVISDSHPITDSETSKDTVHITESEESPIKTTTSTNPTDSHTNSQQREDLEALD